MANAATQGRATSGKEQGAEGLSQVPEAAGLHDRSVQGPSQVPEAAGLHDRSAQGPSQVPEAAGPGLEAITQSEITVKEQTEAFEQLKAEVREQAETIKQLKAKVSEQAETIKQLKAKVSEQAETIKPLETAGKKQLGEMAAFTFPSPVQAKFDRLMDKNNEGKLTPGEHEELGTLVDLNELVTLLKGQARLLLSLAPAAK